MWAEVCAKAINCSECGWNKLIYRYILVSQLLSVHYSWTHVGFIEYAATFIYSLLSRFNFRNTYHTITHNSLTIYLSKISFETSIRSDFMLLYILSWILFNKMYYFLIFVSVPNKNTLPIYIKVYAWSFFVEFLIESWSFCTETDMID